MPEASPVRRAVPLKQDEGQVVFGHLIIAVLLEIPK
jgi:hypothetical protein